MTTSDHESTEQTKEAFSLRKYIRPVLITAIVFAAPWVLLAIWVLPNLFFHNNFSHATLRWASRNFAPGNSMFWWMLISSAVILLFLVVTARRSEYTSYGYSTNNFSVTKNLKNGTKNKVMHYEPGWASILLACVVVLLCFGGFFRSWWNNKDVPRYYNQSTVFAVDDLQNPPKSMRRLVEGAHAGENGCVLEGKHDVPSCLIEESLPAEGFYERSMSYSGAMTYMAQSSGTSSNTNLVTETGAYLEPENGEGNGSWTAIRDGKGIRTPVEGVAVWDGTPGLKPSLCRFDGQYELSRSLRGGRSNSLANLVQEKYSPYYYHMSDVYGGCVDHGGGDVEPVLYIPLITEVRTDHRTVVGPAGLLEVHCSSSGDPRFVYHESVTPEDNIPGPVYPLTIAEIQRDEHSWAAGREFRTRDHFGFEPTSAKEQEGNATEFFLKARWDGREYWVSQMTPRGSNSQLITAYFMIPADVVTAGKLNTQTIYVLNEDDPRVMNLELFINQARQSIADAKVGFFSSGGVLTEFTPAENGQWVGYGLFGGLPSFKVRVDPSDIRPVFESYVTVEGPGEVTGMEACQKPVDQLSAEELVTCLQGFAEQLGQK